MKPSVVRYLPNLLCNWLAENAGGEHSQSRHRQILLFADTSGFTALTRNLSLSGRVGFEHLTDLLNTLFQSLETVMARHNGDILKFSGDAVWCCFPEDTDIIRVYAEMSQQINDLNRNLPICSDHPLSLHAGAGLGEFELLTAASSVGRAEFEICGDCVAEVYRAGDIAKASEICLTPGFLPLSTHLTPVRQQDGFRVYAPVPVAIPADNGMRVEAKASRDDERITKYLPAALVDRIANSAGNDQPGSEHRRVSVVFVNVESTGGAIDSNDLQSHLIKIMDAVHEAKGVIARIDPFGSGHKVLALFGAIVASSGDSLYALRAAAEIARLKTPGFVNRLGLAAGPLLCGEVGSHNRREFTVMGNAVNLAARLMSKADVGGLLLDHDSYRDLGTYCNAVEKMLNLKGFDLPVAVYEFQSLRESQHKLEHPKQFFGRKNELAQLEEAYQRSKADGPVCLAIRGTTGFGKTSLASVFAGSVAHSELLYVDAASSHLRSGGWLIYELLKQVFGWSTVDEFTATMAIHCEPEWLPLVASLGGSQQSAGDSLRDLTPELRVAKAAEIVSNCIGTRLDNKVIILDNLETLDWLSGSILRAMLARLEGIRCLFVLIDTENRWKDSGSRMEAINLEGLTTDDVKEWLGAVFVEGKRELELTSRLIEVAAGNPLLIEESLNYLTVSGAIANISNPEKFDVVESIGEVTLSGRLEELHLAKFDRLPEETRTVLKVAAIFPGQFASTDLLELRQDWDRSRLEILLSELQSEDILVSVASVQKVSAPHYRFKRSELRETIYNRTPVLQLQLWHRQAAERLCKMSGPIDLYQIAFHYAHADQPTEAFRFNFRAARAALDAGLPLDASRYFLQCYESLQLLKDNPLSAAERFEYFRHSADFYSSEGNYSRAYNIVRRWRKLARSVGDRKQLHAAVNGLVQLFWKQSRYNLCRPTLKYINKEFANSDPALLAESLSLQGELFRRTGKIREAQESCTKAVELANTAHDQQRQAQALNNLGLANWTGGNLDAAAESFEKCLSLHEARSARYMGARIANNLAIISEEKGAYIRAHELASRARQIFVEYGDRRNQSYASGNLANLQMQAGRFREATELFTTADRIFVHLGELHPHHYTIGNLADIDLVLGRISAAIEKYETVMAYAKSCGDKELEAETAVRLTECAFYGGETEGVGARYQEAIDIAKEAGSLEYQTRGTVGYCRHLIGLRDVESARVRVEQLEKIAADMNSLRNLNEAKFLQGELSRITGDTANAVALYNETNSYAREQEQFELLLKSLVRLAEIDDLNAGRHRIELAKLMDKFSGWNGNEILQALLASRYYGYFQATLQEALKLSSIGRSLYSVG